MSTFPPSSTSTSGPDIPKRVQDILNSAPTRQTALFYQAAILAIGLHIFVLALIYFSTARSDSAVQTGDTEPLLEEFDLQFVEEEELAIEQANPEESTESVKDLIAGAQSVRTGSMVQFTGKSKAEIEAEVAEQLRGLEEAEFERLRTGRSEVSESIPDKAEPKNKDGKNADRENYDWFKNQSDKSYSGPVSAEFDLAGRSTRATPRPTYRCQTDGKVVVNIEVDQMGNVISATIDEALSSADECIRGESKGYAEKWKFDYNTSAGKKQRGKITFTFSRQ